MGTDGRWPWKKKPAPVLPVPRVGLGVHDLDSLALVNLGRMNVRRIRYTIYWSEWVKSQAYRDWVHGRLHHLHYDRGIEVLAVFHGRPEEMVDDYEAEASYLHSLEEAVRSLPWIAAWQIGNEKPLRGDGFLDANLHQRAYERVKAIALAAKVVSMSMDPTSEWGRAWTSYRPDADAIAIHVYNWPLPLTMKDDVARARATGYPVWVTEYGSGRNSIPPEMHGDWQTIQAQQLKEATEAARGAERAYVYQYQTREDRKDYNGIVSSWPDQEWYKAAYWLAGHLEVYP